MRRTAFGTATFSLFWGLAAASPCLADNFHSYVAANGSGAACTLTAPCGTFGGALAVTRDGGEITCLTGGPNGSIQGINISQSVTIDCPDFSAAVTINATGVVVTLRHMTIDGANSLADGIEFQNGAALFVENCVIQNWTDFGIRFRPENGAAKLHVTDSVVKNNGSAGDGGIYIEPASGAEADVVITRTQVQNNRVGIFAEAGGGTIHGTVRDSVVSGSTTWGIGVVGTKANLSIENTTLTGNNNGLVAESGASMLVSHSSIVQNGTGLFRASGGALVSFKNNNLSRNTSDGTFSSTLVQQ